MASGLRTIFFGTPEFASVILEYLLSEGENIVAVVTTPPKNQGRGMKLQKSPVHQTADRHALPVLTPNKLRDPDFLNSLEGYGADLFCVIAFKILPKEVFTLPRFGSFNVHASLLPKFRGAAPINWAIIRGETSTGITTFLLDDKVDTGKILLSEAIEIGENETAGELHDRLMHLGAKLALQTIRGLANHSLAPQSQASGLATTAPKIFPKDCIVNFNQSSREVHNFIRGLSPYPGAVTIIAGSRLKLLKSLRAVQTPEFALKPAEFRVYAKKRLFVGTADGMIEILELQREGRSAMNTEEFLRGSGTFFV